MIIVVQIGNTDNKLTQQEWNHFVIETGTALLENDDTTIHFFGGASNWEPWQNVCWVVGTRPKGFSYLKARLKEIRLRFKQDSIALTTGTTELL